MIAPADVPVVHWRREVHRARTGLYVRVDLYLDERSGKPVLLLASSTHKAGLWEPMGLVVDA